MARVLFTGGTLVDGTGAPPRCGDLLISGETIAETDSFEAPTDVQVIDCHGLAVAPGFIDSHSHSDLQVLENRREKVAQGVTAEVVGNPFRTPADSGESPRRACSSLLQGPLRQPAETLAFGFWGSGIWSATTIQAVDTRSAFWSRSRRKTE